MEENIRTSRHYLLAVSGDWGPPERNFRRDYEIACACRADPALPMRDVAVLIRKSGGPHDPSLPVADAQFASMDDFRDTVRRLLSSWLSVLVEAR